MLSLTLFYRKGLPFLNEHGLFVISIYTNYFTLSKNIIMQQKTNYSKGEYCFGNIHCFLLVVGESSSSYSSLNSPRSFSDGSSRIFPPLIYRMFVFIY